MEKVKISISGHDFYLKSEDPNRMYETAENLQKRIDKLSAMAASMSLTDIVMLAALDIADENYDNRNVVIKACLLYTSHQPPLSRIQALL